MNYLIIAASSACVYIFIILAIRFFGKKELAQLSVIDLVFILLISNSVQNAMVGPDTSLLGGLVAATSLFVINTLFKFFMYKFPQFSHTLQGEPITLVLDGKILTKSIRKAQLSIGEIEEAAREHGVAEVSDVDLAVLEVDGNISILSHNYQSKSKRKRKHYKNIV